jgi:hypothetical protein
MMAWLITWNKSGNHEQMDNTIAAILNYSLPAEKVREIVELLYVDRYASLSERLAYARDRKNNPYPAECNTTDGVSVNTGITCGHDPWLYARIVDNIILNIAIDGKESLSWKEREKPEPSGVTPRAKAQEG